MGSAPLGIDTIAFLDSNEFTCEVLRQNFHAPVIHGDVADPQCFCAMHSTKPQGFVQVTGGFPCQPFSRQGDEGDMQGILDVRGKVLPAILRWSWLLQSNAVLFECVAYVMRFRQAQEHLDHYADQANIHIERLLFDLEV